MSTVTTSEGTDAGPADGRVGEPLPAPAPAVAAGADAAPQPKTFPGELSMSFEEAVALLDSTRARSWWQRMFGAHPRAGRTIEQADVPIDGFHGGGFEAKRERKRRYGGVYLLQERGNGFFLRLEFPRRVPHSALKDRLHIPDEMPDYGYDLALLNGGFVVKGHVENVNLRKLAGVSPSFPPDFTTHIKLPAQVAGFKHRFVAKTLEVVLVKQ